ncbi:MAG: hypothetical protein V4686_03205 [Patescibacteria group bacterium]
MKEQNPMDIPEAEKITEAHPMVTEQEMFDAVEALCEDPVSTLEYEAETQSKIEDVRKKLEETPEVHVDHGGNGNYTEVGTSFTGGEGNGGFTWQTVEALPLDDVDIFKQVFGGSFFGGVFNMLRPSKWKEYIKKRKENEDYNHARYGHLNK